MTIKNLQKNWDTFGKTDPMWAILTDPNKKGNKWEKEDFFRTGREEIQHLIDTTNHLNITFNRAKALDFGCGIGRLTQGLVGHFSEVHGVDIAPSMIDQAKEINQFPDQCFYHLNGVDNLQLFEDKAFDLVYSNITLQHMRPQFAFNYIKEFLRIVNPNGCVIFQLPAKAPDSYGWLYKYVPTFVLNLMRRLVFRSDAVMEMYYSGKEEVLSFLEKNGGATIHVQAMQEPDGGVLSYRYFIKKRQF